MEYRIQDFVYLRPVYIAIIIFLLAQLVIVVFQNKKKLINHFSFFSIIFICVSISTISSISIGYISDELGLGGDPTSSYMWLLIIGLSIANTFVFLKKQKQHL